MDKKLTPLEALERIGKCDLHSEREDYYFLKNCYANEYSVIETALKNYDELTTKPVILYGRAHGHTQKLIDTICKNYKEVKITNLEDEKKLKALEIIKARPEQLLDILETDNYNEYLDLDYAPNQYISEKEYDLLKEILL